MILFSVLKSQNKRERNIKQTTTRLKSVYKTLLLMHIIHLLPIVSIATNCTIMYEFQTLCCFTLGSSKQLEEGEDLGLKPGTGHVSSLRDDLGLRPAATSFSCSDSEWRKWQR